MIFNVQTLYLLVVFQSAPQAHTVRTVVSAVTTAGEGMCVTMKMGRVLIDVIRGIERTSVTQVTSFFST